MNLWKSVRSICVCEACAYEACKDAMLSKEMRKNSYKVSLLPLLLVGTPWLFPLDSLEEIEIHEQHWEGLHVWI